MKDWEILLKEKGFTLLDVTKAFIEKIDYLRYEKKTVKIKLASGRFRIENAGRFVALIQESYPIKMFVLQEVGTELRLGYYVVNLKTLRDTGKLVIGWGEYCPFIPKGDFNAILKKAKEARML